MTEQEYMEISTLARIRCALSVLRDSHSYALEAEEQRELKNGIGCLVEVADNIAGRIEPVGDEGSSEQTDLESAKSEIRALREECLGLLRQVQVSIGDGRVVCPRAIAPHIWNIRAALAATKESEGSND